ncbi:hypothetical protein SmJEL517_g01589 [Synchytrium microbalum]|uniref:Cytochrome b5 heme-binding domain-containing protein n=1 Tax=Synchytrium microbalum TaxID=1806994 RepID=A0A507CE89_9FUNG|nr:uncharacterized protein SmJEL517_g01589 [Synchytrium microbalum]TPX36244.1 hypothetical protein SmJEL517_g01589 [Synchytrium microbalum]
MSSFFGKMFSKQQQPPQSDSRSTFLDQDEGLGRAKFTYAAPPHASMWDPNPNEQQFAQTRPHQDDRRLNKKKSSSTGMRQVIPKDSSSSLQPVDRWPVQAVSGANEQQQQQQLPPSTSYPVPTSSSASYHQPMPPPQVQSPQQIPRLAPSPQTSPQRSVKPLPLPPTKLQAVALQNAHERNSRISMLGFTWESLDESITNGNGLYVVANSKYVYDISKWINDHPGGNNILYSAAGTDVTLDYFRESGFDADDFIPIKQVNHVRKQVPSIPRSSTSSLALPAPRLSDLSLSELSLNDRALAHLRFSEGDIIRIKRARKTNVHSRNAIQKLSSLLVGEIVPSEPQKRVEEGELRPFDKYEYRRYAITEVTSVNASSTNPAYQIRFVLLYPFDTRKDEPTSFHGGECIEIQIRVQDQWHSRYYTPISGSPTAFEVIVKTYPTGLMSQFLTRQNPGDRQFKIRGPFGTQIFHPQKPLQLSSPAWTPERLIYICGGSGITPFLQALHSMLFPVLTPLAVITDYLQTAEDELSLARGDVVYIKTNFYDGWVLGSNLTTHQDGIFPLACTAPFCGLKTKITLINQIQTVNDVIGGTILEGSMLSYSSQVKIHHIIAKGVDLKNMPAGVSGFVHQGKLNEAMLEQLVARTWDTTGATSQKIVIIGPRGFDGTIVDILTDLLSVSIDVADIKIMPGDRFI